MKTTIKLVLLTIICLQNGYSQKNFELELREGFIFYDLFKDKNDIYNTFQGYGMQTDVSLIYRYEMHPRYDVQFGLGYSNFYFLDPAMILTGQNLFSSYMSLKIGVDGKLTNRLALSLAANNYILLHKEKLGTYQKRMFTNMDLGFRIDLADRWKLYVTSPISISPIAGTKDFGYYIPQVGSVRLNSYVEMTGLNIGLRYAF